MINFSEFDHCTKKFTTAIATNQFALFIKNNNSKHKTDSDSKFRPPQYI